MVIRHAAAADVPALARLEALCFPKAEAASKAAFAGRVAAYSDHFWLLESERGELVSFVNGPVTRTDTLTDDLYADPACHAPDGDWQMIFGVDTRPDFRRRGCAGLLLRAAILQAREEGRRGLVLTCKERLVPYYASFGFASEGLSVSAHGGAVWYQMRLTL